MSDNNIRTAKTPEELKFLGEEMLKLNVRDRHLAMGFLKKDANIIQENMTECFKILLRVGYFIEDKPTDVELIELYKQFGIDVEIPKGRCWHSKHLVSAPFDGIPYCMDEHGHYKEKGNDNTIKNAIEARTLIIENFHLTIKPIYEYLFNKNIGDIWVVCSDSQHVYFGNYTGYLACLYLKKNDPTRNVRLKKSVLAIQFKENNIHFKGFKMDNIRVEKSG